MTAQNLNFNNQTYFNPNTVGGNSVTQTHAMSGVSGISILSGGNDLGGQSTVLGYTNKLGMKIAPTKNVKNKKLSSKRNIGNSGPNRNNGTNNNVSFIQGIDSMRSGGKSKKNKILSSGSPNENTKNQH